MGQGFSAAPIRDAAQGLTVPEAVQLAPVAAVALDQLNRLPPSLAGGEGGVMIDPPALAEKLLLFRREAAIALRRELEETGAFVAEVRRASLESAMSAQE